MVIEGDEAVKSETKPKGWFGTAVKEHDVLLRKLQDDITSYSSQIDDFNNTIPKLFTLLDHPIVREFEQWERRLKRMEQAVQPLVENQQRMNLLVLRAEKLLDKVLRELS